MKIEWELSESKFLVLRYSGPKHNVKSPLCMSYQQIHMVNVLKFCRPQLSGI